jgi:hypothetical protein
MTKSTLEDLIAFMYDESNAAERANIEEELKDDWTLREKYNVLRESFERLNKMKLQSPRKESVNAILRYACCTSDVSVQ